MSDENELLPPEDGQEPVSRVGEEELPESVTPVVTAAPGPRRRTGAIWWGVAFVFLGIALLISQFVPVAIEVWRFWPLIIVALGVRQMFGPSTGRWTIKHLGEGLGTISIGLVFLGQMLGYLQWNVWLNILRLWPLLLVALGLEIIGKAMRSEFVRFLSNIVLIAGLAYGALVMTQTAGFPFPLVNVGESEAFTLSASNESGVERAEAEIDGGVGELNVSAGGDLVTADGATPFEPVFDVSTTGDEAEIRVGLGEGVWGPTEPRSYLDVTLDADVVWNLDIDAGVSDYDIDLRDLVLSGLTMQAGVSNGTLTLGEPDDTAVRVDIDSGVSSLTIRVPRRAATRVTVGAGLSGVDTEGDWDSSRDGEDRVYESDGFSTEDAYWDIVVDAGISGITIEYY